MDPITLIVLATLGLIGSAAGAGASIYSAKKNYESTVNTNNQNIAMQREVNAQAQYNLEHQHQIEMADLQAAGLNPVLTAMGGSGAGAAYLNAPQAKTPMMDFSGIGTAVQGATHMMSSLLMMKMMQSNNQARNDTLTAIANSRNAQSAANAVLANQSKNPYYDAKTELIKKRLASGKAGTYSAKQFHDKTQDVDYSPEFIEELLKEFKDR